MDNNTKGDSFSFPFLLRDTREELIDRDVLTGLRNEQTLWLFDRGGFYNAMEGCRDRGIGIAGPTPVLLPLEFQSNIQVCIIKSRMCPRSCYIPRSVHAGPSKFLDTKSQSGAAPDNRVKI